MVARLQARSKAVLVALGCAGGQATLKHQIAFSRKTLQVWHSCGRLFPSLDAVEALGGGWSVPENLKEQVFQCHKFFRRTQKSGEGEELDLLCDFMCARYARFVAMAVTAQPFEGL